MKASVFLLALVAACGGADLRTTVSLDAGTGDAGGCLSDSECAPGTCTSGSCGPSTCNPSCPAWQTCTGRTCLLNPGGCNTDADCPAPLPVCNPSHQCTAPAVATPATLSYSALIVTNQAYAPAFRELALLHTLTGVPTRVITLEEICGPSGCSASDTCHDAPRALKSYLIAQQQLGLRQVVLGGDASIVPSRQTSDHFSNAIYGVTYDETFYSDYYFADLSEWDTNGDCIYGDPINDSPGYLPSLGVTRISVSSPEELNVYLGKVLAYLTRYDLSRINTALLLSNIATEVTVPVINQTVPVDAALYFQTPKRTISLIPAADEITRLYSSLKWPGASPLTVPAEETAFQQGYNLIVHSGHGDEGDLTVEQDGSNAFSGAMAEGLQNTQYPILLSCACQAATFADGDQCAGQNFLTAPNGGGVGYLGNSTLGLGIAGGMQLIDGLLRAAFSSRNPLIGEAVLAGHANLPTSDGLDIPVPVIGTVTLSVIDAASWRWTQKAATYLGDGLLPFYTDATLTQAPSFSVSRKALGNFSKIAFTPSSGGPGVLAVAIGSSVYELSLDGSGSAVTLTVAGAPGQLALGFSSASTLSAFQRATLP